MDAVAWFMAGGIAALIGAMTGVLIGAWMSWLAAIAAGVLMTAMSRRPSSLVGAVFVVAFVSALIVKSILWTVCLTILGVALVFLGSLAAISAAKWAVARRPPRDAFALEPVDAPPTTRVDPEQHERRPSPVQRTSGSGLASVPLLASQVDRLIGLAERDTAAFRAALTQLSAEQRQQVRQALSARRRRAEDGSS